MCTTEGSSILSCEGHREHLFSTTPTFVSDVFPLSQGLGAADLPVSLLLGQGPFLGFWCCDVCCPSGSLPTESMDVQLAGQGAGGQQSSAGQLPHSVPAAVGCSERAGEAASLCCLLPLLSLCLGSERPEVLPFLQHGCLRPLAGRRRRREEKVVAAWDGDNCHGTQQSPLSWKAWLCLLEKKSEHESVCLPSSQNSFHGWKFSSDLITKSGKTQDKKLDWFGLYVILSPKFEHRQIRYT